MKYLEYLRYVPLLQLYSTKPYIQYSSTVLQYCTIYSIHRGTVLSGLAEQLLGLEEMGQKFSLKRVSGHKTNIFSES